MSIEPAAEESARHLLDLFESRKLRAGEMLIREPTKTEFLQDRQWHANDFAAGLQYASQHHWITIPSPHVIKLTEEGVCAYARPEAASSTFLGRGK